MKDILLRMASYDTLHKEEAKKVMLEMAAGALSNEEIAAFLAVYMMRPITLDELIGFREALLETAKKVDLSQYETIDIVGTGGDGKNTFNISTLSCFVLAGAGYKVAKHGNFGASSVSGASNVLQYYGVKFTNDENVIREAIERAGMCYMHAPLFNPGMKYAAPVRKALKVPTFFNLMGPLINPANPKYQLWGINTLKNVRLYNYIAQKTGLRYTLVHSTDGYDEISLTSSVKIVTNTEDHVIEPEDLGFRRVKMEELSGGDTVDSAALIFKKVLENEATEGQKNAVLVNSAYAIHTIEPNKSICECVQIAKESLESGKAKKVFERFAEIYS